MITRITANLLIFALIFVSLAACAKTPDKPAGTTTEETHFETEYTLPVVDYDNYKFNIAYTNTDTTFDYWEFDYPEQTGETIQDAFYIRNLNIEERYNIELVPHLISMQQISQSIIAGDDEYDIIFDRTAGIVGNMTKGLFLNLYNIPHLDLSQNFWDQNSVSDLSVANNLYMVAGDIHLSSFDCTWTLYFDKMLVNEYNMQSPYDLIDQNKWTFDIFYEMCSAVSDDINGDGKMDYTDFWGFSTHQGTYPAMITAAGEKFISKDNNDQPMLAMQTDNFHTAYIKVLTIMHENDATYEQIKRMGTFDRNQQCDIFIEDRSIFYSEVMNNISTILREKENDYGVLPWPKLNETQNRYYNYVNEAAGMMCLPVTSLELDRTGLITQALAHESSKTVRYAYYDIAMVNKYSRDDRMEEMLDIIFANRTYELAFVYGWGGMAQNFYSLAVANKTDLASFVAKYEKVLQKDIEKFVNNIVDLEY